MSEEHVVINIIHKDGETTVEPQEQETNLNLNLDEVKVKTKSVYVEFDGASSADSDISLEGSIIENAGDGKLRLTLECGDNVVLYTEKTISALLRAAQLPPATDE